MNTQPDALFTGTLGAAERRYLRTVIGASCARDYCRVVDPFAGACTTAVEATKAGLPTSACHLSDVSLYSAVVGSIFSGVALDELGVTVDEELLSLPDDACDAGARILYELWRLRMERQSDRPYWAELRRNVAEERLAHLAGFRIGLAAARERLAGVSYQSINGWRVLDTYLDDPNAIVILHPPAQKRAYERLFATDGRMTWAEPEYDVFDPKTDLAILVDRMACARALVLLFHDAPVGESWPTPVYARVRNAGRATYCSTNRANEVADMLRLVARPRPGADSKRLKNPIIPADYRVSERSTVQLLPVDRATAYYYRDLWLHKLDFHLARFNWAITIDGYMAGMAGYGSGPLIQVYGDAEQGDALVLTYAVGAPFDGRLTRLIAAVAIQEDTLRTVLKPWQAIGCTRIMTTQLTKNPESKEHRGTPMKLQSREKDATYGYKLVYEAPLQPGTATDAVRAWVASERAYRERRGR